MRGTQYTTKEEVLRKAQDLIGIPLGEIDTTGRLSTGKGAIGTVIEESWFGYTPNSESEPDFPEAGVELKATPFLRSKDKIRAKERLVCNMISYMTEHDKSFYTSAFWYKNSTLLIMSYEHKYDVSKAFYFIERAILYNFPEEDRRIIEQDWEKIIAKVRAGQAHLLTEGDTLYLAACTKGANAEDTTEQPFSPVKAKRRAYSLKTSYMTRLLNTYIFGNQEDERIIKDWRDLSQKTFEEIILEKLSPYFGKTQKQLKEELGVFTKGKNTNDRLVARMLGINGNIADAEEFQRANITSKTVRVQKNGTIQESMSFPAFDFKKIITEDWEDSTLLELLEPTKFLFLIFEEQQDGQYVFARSKFWNIPMEDLEEVQKVWTKTVETLKRGVSLSIVSGRVTNDLPKEVESRVAHVRPHAQRSFYVFEDGTTYGNGNLSDTSELPDGRRMTKQCFWLNRNYVKSIIGQ